MGELQNWIKTVFGVGTTDVMISKYIAVHRWGNCSYRNLGDARARDGYQQRRLKLEIIWTVSRVPLASERVCRSRHTQNTDCWSRG